MYLAYSCVIYVGNYIIYLEAMWQCTKLKKKQSFTIQYVQIFYLHTKILIQISDQKLKKNQGVKPGRGPRSLVPLALWDVLAKVWGSKFKCSILKDRG